MNPDLQGSKLKGYAKIINSASKQLLAIINDLLLMATIETGQLKFSKKSVNINTLLTQIFNFYKPQLDSILIKFMLEKGLNNADSTIQIDEFRLRQVIDNLMVNAIKFTANGEITLGYRLNGDTLYFYVKDTGIGIKPEHHELIFERFKQVDPDYLNNFNGMGLGLAICKTLVEKMGGKIGVKSEPGKGSEFFFTIPFIREVKQVVKNEEKTKNSKNNGKCEVLIVDDEPNNLILLEEILSMDNSLIIHKAINGKEAVEVCKSQNNIQIIFMDIKMPVMNGIEATGVIKKEYPNIKVIAQSAYTSNTDKNAALCAGCNEFISKPVNMNILFELIKKYKKD